MKLLIISFSLFVASLSGMPPTGAIPVAESYTHEGTGTIYSGDEVVGYYYVNRVRQGIGSRGSYFYTFVDQDLNELGPDDLRARPMAEPGH